MKSGGVILLLFLSFSVLGQEIRKANKRDATICYAKYVNENTYVPPPRAFTDRGARVKTADFEVTYIGFSSEAKTAFQAAVDIWSTLIISESVIRITATWEPLDNGVLGSASSGSFIRDFPGAQRQRTWYPIALAEKISGKEFNGTQADIEASFNSSNSSWFYGISGGTPPGKYDLVSIVLHEIGHGLGINHNYTVSGVNGLVVNDDFAFTYAAYIENSSNQNIVIDFSSPSPLLKTQLTSEDLFFNSPLVLSGNANAKAKLYAPSTFSAGSSVAHVDEETYPAGNINSLMTPQIGFAETIHDPGPIALGILNDLGWKGTLIQHTALLNTEDINADYTIKCSIDSDNGYLTNSVKLNYASDGKTFTQLAMSPTGVANEYFANLPHTGSAVKYNYFFSVTDNSSRKFLRPGKIFLQGQDSTQQTFQFEAGPDHQTPKIVHDAKPFILDTDATLKLQAVVSDNIGIQNVKVKYMINDLAQSDLVMTLVEPKEDSVYEASINFSPLLHSGDILKYQIQATDNSIAQNQITTPSLSTYFTVPVTGLLPAQNSYSNKFNSTTTDFFGDNLFSIQKSTGFANGAIHIQHPYPNGSGPDNESNFVYQLKIPVKLKSSDSFIRFDEVVLVEPSEDGAVFGSADFFDYVIVEGSKDKGTTWRPLLDGYNSTSQSVWLTRFNSAKDDATQPNSTATGDSTLYRPREIDLLAAGNFTAGDEVVVRFRLFSDQLVHGWGWAIDNLRIQLDDIPPKVLHDHLNYQLKGNSVFKITTKATDATGLASLIIDYKINDQPVEGFSFPISSDKDLYSLEQTVEGITTGDIFSYRIRATDLSGNETVLPNTGYFTVPVIELAPPASQYISNFNATNNDFVGNFFSISQPTGFNNGLIQTVHPYPAGFGLTQTSDLTYLLKTPVIISESNPFISFDEIVIVESAAAVAADYVVVEASKDNGATWQSVVDPYDASSNSVWTSSFTNQRDGSSSMFKSRLINLITNGKFKSGDQVLIRFRLFTNSANTGWGWAIDNLSIQGPVTGLEPSTESVVIFPNPVENGKVSIELRTQTPQSLNLTFFDIHGRQLANDYVETNEQPFKKEYDVNWMSGLYLLRIEGKDKTVIHKFMVK